MQGHARRRAARTARYWTRVVQTAALAGFLLHRSPREWIVGGCRREELAQWARRGEERSLSKDLKRLTQAAVAWRRGKGGAFIEAHCNTAQLSRSLINLTTPPPHCNTALARIGPSSIISGRTHPIQGEAFLGLILG